MSTLEKTSRWDRGLIVRVSIHLAIGAAFFFLACYALFITISFQSVFSSMSHWIPTPCTLVQSALIPSFDSLHEEPTHKLMIRYRYDYADHLYEAEPNITVSNVFNWIEKPSQISGEPAKKYYNKHPTGTQTTCYVNPKAPTEFMLAEIKPLPASPMFRMQVLFGILLVLSCVPFWWGYRSWTRAKRQSRNRGQFACFIR